MVKNVFDGMSGAYAAMFTPYACAKRFAALGIVKEGQALNVVKGMSK